MLRCIADVRQCFAEVSPILPRCFGDNSHIKRKPKTIADHQRSSAIISEESAIICVSSAMIGDQINRKEVLDVNTKTFLRSIAPKFAYFWSPMGDLFPRTIGKNWKISWKIDRMDVVSQSLAQCDQGLKQYLSNYRYWNLCYPRIIICLKQYLSNYRYWKLFYPRIIICLK